VIYVVSPALIDVGRKGKESYSENVDITEALVLTVVKILFRNVTNKFKMIYIYMDIFQVLFESVIQTQRMRQLRSVRVFD